MNLKKLRSLHHRFLFNCLAAFLGMCVSDWLWVRSVANISEGQPFMAATWATLYATISAVLTISFVKDYRVVIPYMLGAFVGTYFGV
jgi:hypothetical protein